LLIAVGNGGQEFIEFACAPGHEIQGEKGDAHPHTRPLFPEELFSVLPSTASGALPDGLGNVPQK